ncbi:MAG: hypothetical protein MUF00_09550 [Gemmatimonadaceae bacterium]|jgi:high-affinity Fe2+/Pb2+ permease|nr:hypothetical protein [Gemmatimonadaceae bacterium]
MTTPEKSDTEANGRHGTDESLQREVRKQRSRRIGLAVAFAVTLLAYFLADGLSDVGDRKFARTSLKYLGFFIAAFLATSVSVKDEARYNEWKRRRRRR